MQKKVSRTNRAAARPAVQPEKHSAVKLLRLVRSANCSTLFAANAAATRKCRSNRLKANRYIAANASSLTENTKNLKRDRLSVSFLLPAKRERDTTSASRSLHFI